MWKELEVAYFVSLGEIPFLNQMLVHDDSEEQIASIDFVNTL